jgi:uncharacterized protein YjiS (DUF1127 family)
MSALTAVLHADARLEAGLPDQSLEPRTSSMGTIKVPMATEGLPALQVFPDASGITASQAIGAPLTQRTRFASLANATATIWLPMERRRQRRALAELDDRLLRDIGLTRADACKKSENRSGAARRSYLCLDRRPLWVLVARKPFCGSFGRKIDSNRMLLAYEGVAKAASSIPLLHADVHFRRFRAARVATEELASELVHIGQFVMHEASTIDPFDAIFAVPTRSEAFKYAAYDALIRLDRRAAPRMARLRWHRCPSLGRSGASASPRQDVSSA